LPVFACDVSTPLSELNVQDSFRECGKNHESAGVQWFGYLNLDPSLWKSHWSCTVCHL